MEPSKKPTSNNNTITKIYNNKREINFQCKITSNRNLKLIKNNPNKALRKLVIPILIINFIITMYTITDGIWISGINSAAIVAVLLFQGLSKGTYSLVWTLIREFILFLFFVYFFGFIMNWRLIGI